MATPPKKTIAQKTKEAAKQLELELVQFKLGKTAISFNLDVDHETIWATQDQIASLFERERSVISKHVGKIIEEGELEESAVCAKFAQIGPSGKPSQVTHYNLDMILSVGYRVSSPKATEFRKWATATLRSYIVDGYAINEARLKDSPAALRKLAARIRELRSDEKNIYAAVRECFKEASSDYDNQSSACRSFFALMQDKFLYAVTQSTASQLILGRADRKTANMGVVHFGGNMPSITEAQIGKNYLDSDELYILHILCEQFLLYAESSAIRGKTLRMADLTTKLDSLLSVNDYPVFKGYKDYLRDKAINHAKAEYAMWQRRLSKDDPKKLTPA
ncbi:RhuM family protein [Mesorhizobium sp. M0698]|uniref:RhuM family protein n=1 Tax=Mesorhizobium sp. M0698 TaxID=2956987 RepID=UPI00333B2C70